MEQKPYRTLLLWLTWASLSIAVDLSLYTDYNVLDYIRSDTTRITWVILGLFLVGGLMSFMLTMILTREAVTTAAIEKATKDKGLLGIEKLGYRRAAERVFHSLKTVCASNEVPDVNAIISIEFAVYQRTSHAVEVIGNLLITLGLIGTVIGLIMTMTGLSSSMQSLGQNQDAMMKGLRHAMSGMGTSFYTTLLGAVLGGLVLRVFSLITEHGIDSINDGLMRSCLVYCVQDFKPSLNRDVRMLSADIETLGGNVRLLQQVFDDTRSAMAEFREETLRLQNLMEDPDERATLRKSLRMHKYYRALLRRELELMNRINQSWGSRLLRALRGRP